VATPASATASVLFDAVTATASQAWLVGESDSPAGGGRPPIESYAAGTWSVASLPASAGSDWTNLYGLAQADGSVWAAGTYVDASTDNNNALVLRETDGTWTVDNAPDPGSGSNIPGGITAVGGQLWLAGMYDNGGSELPLIEHR
jgi:hypothetical protein